MLYGTTPAGDAKQVAEMAGARAVALQKMRGGTIMVISAVLNGHRVSREVPVHNGTVAAHTFNHALQTLRLGGGK
jgi:hypothetical protein